MDVVAKASVCDVCAMNNSNNGSADVKQRNYNNRIFVCHAGVIRNNTTSVFASHVCVCLVSDCAGKRLFPNRVDIKTMA